MRKTFLVMVMVLLVAGPAGVAFAEDKVLATVSGEITGEKGKVFQVDKVLKDDGVWVQVSGPLPDKSLVWTSENLGVEEKTFTLDGKAESLALKDLTGDSVPEVVTAAFYGPKASGMWVFTWSGADKKFVPIVVTHPKEDLTRDFFVADIQQESGGELVIGPDGKVTCLGLIYSEKEGEEPQPAQYVYELKDGKYVFAERKPLPAKP
ncbi:MAG: hypothetical protein GX442_13565 [Candidatus Riflebacteria bacterium]|nr:hypothetical protein [Candidatus Riflebacteria bacterium]